MHPDAVEYQRQRWTRPDAERWLKPDPERWLSPEELRLEYPELYERKYGGRLFDRRAWFLRTRGAA
jgi:glycine/D-amino acid oxidase-like deaminating enzyme